MKKILSTTAIASSLCLLGTSLLQAQTFKGPYIDVSGAMGGISTSVKKTGGTGTAGDATGNAQVGKVFGFGSIGLGYAFPMSKESSFAIGASYIPGKAEIKGQATDGGTGAADADNTVTFKIDDIYTVYAQPNFEINKDAAAFLRVQYFSADVKGTNSATSVTGLASDIEGWGIGGGLKVALTKNTYVQTEIMYTELDSLSARSATNRSSSHTRTFSASKPELIEGRITLGYQF